MKENMKDIANGMNPEKAMELAKKMGASPEALKKMETGMYKSRAVGGDVMKESAMLALEYIHSHAGLFGIDEGMFENWNVHIHVPEGAIPKDQFPGKKKVGHVLEYGG